MPKKALAHKALARFQRGLKVKISCYHTGCGKTSLSVTLGEELEIHLAFIQLGRVGQLRWQPSATVKGFELSRVLGGSGYCNCPNCKTQFGAAIVISNGKGKRPTIFGYEAESG